LLFLYIDFHCLCLLICDSAVDQAGDRIRYKPFAASEIVINFSPAARHDGNMDLAMNQTCLILLQIARAPQSCANKTQLKQIISSREVTFQGAKPESGRP
jgi:hypothetical protein